MIFRVLHSIGTIFIFHFFIVFAEDPNFVLFDPQAPHVPATRGECISEGDVSCDGMEHLTSLLNYLDSRLETVESLTSYLDKLKGIPEREEMNRIVGEIFFLSRSIQQKKTEYEKEQAE